MVGTATHKDGDRHGAAMSKAESREQFRSLFAKHEPETLKVLDSFIEVFGREQIKNLCVYCPT